MALLAKRVSALIVSSTCTSVSATPMDLASRSTVSTTLRSSRSVAPTFRPRAAPDFRATFIVRRKPCQHFSLVNPRPDARGKPRIILATLHVRLGERHALHATHLGVRSQQQRQLRLQRNLEWVLAKRTLPAIHVRIFRRHHYVSALRQRRSLRDRDGLRRAGRHTFLCHSVRRRKSPRAVRQHANANPNRLRLRQRPHPPVLGRQV